jgi:hypothetical protein
MMGAEPETGNSRPALRADGYRLYGKNKFGVFAL